MIDTIAWNTASIVDFLRDNLGKKSINIKSYGYYDLNMDLDLLHIIKGRFESSVFNNPNTSNLYSLNFSKSDEDIYIRKEGLGTLDDVYATPDMGKAITKDAKNRVLFISNFIDIKRELRTHNPRQFPQFEIFFNDGNSFNPFVMYFNNTNGGTDIVIFEDTIFEMFDNFYFISKWTDDYHYNNSTTSDSDEYIIDFDFVRLQNYFINTMMHLSRKLLELSGVSNGNAITIDYMLGLCMVLKVYSVESDSNIITDTMEETKRNSIRTLLLNYFVFNYKNLITNHLYPFNRLHEMGNIVNSVIDFFKTMNKNIIQKQSNINGYIKIEKTLYDVVERRKGEELQREIFDTMQK